MKINYYHCSTINHGQILVIKKQCPRLKADKETHTPRLCVAPTIAACFAARIFNHGPVYVYKTIKPVNAVKPINVWDQCITKERWLIEGTLNLYTIISNHICEEAYTSLKILYQIKKMRSSLRIRACQYNEIVNTFKKHNVRISKSEQNYIDDVMNCLDINADYILNLAESYLVAI